MEAVLAENPSVAHAGHRGGPGVDLGLPRFRGEVRSWDQGIWLDGIVSSSLGRSFGSAESIFSSRPAPCQGRRVERPSRTAGTLAVQHCDVFRPLLDGREHDGMLVCTGFESVRCILALELNG